MWAAPPVVDFLFPAGGQRGATLAVKADGKFDPPGAALQAWCDSGSIHVTPLKDKEPGSLQIQIDKDAPIGPHLIRLYNADGASVPRLFIVGEFTEALESEPNDDPANAQPTTLPVTINGQLEKSGDVDCYAVRLSAGETLVASVLGRRLGAPMDPMLHLLDSSGIELAFAHDGLGLDPLLVYRAPQSGTYVVRVAAFSYPPAADVRLTGSKADVYRLTLTTGPAARYALPSGVRRDEAQPPPLRLSGWNLPTSAPPVIADAARLAAFDDHVFIPAPGLDGWLRVEVGDGPEMLAANALAPDTILPVPCAITGRIDAARVEHRFRFGARKGEALRFAVRAGAMNSSLDPLVQIFDARGASLASANGNGGPSDPSLNWTAPADGLYSVAVADLFHKGGPDYVYRLEVRRPAPAFSATIDNHLYRLTPGKTGAVIKVNVARRDGHAAPLVAVATGLPPRVTATSADVAPKATEVSLTLTAEIDAPAANAPIRVMVLGADPVKPESCIAGYNLRAEKEAAEELIDFAAPWLTVLPPPPPAATAPSSQPATRPAK